MPNSERSKTVGENTIHPGEAKFVIQNSSARGGGQAVVNENEAPAIAEALARWSGLRRASYRKDAALLVGGPKHGEFVSIPPGAHWHSYYCHANILPAFGHEIGEIGREEYHRADDISDGLPFVIYEHSSVRGANVRRRAEQLDRELAQAQEGISRSRRYLDVANTGRSKAEVRKREAVSALDTARGRVLAADKHLKDQEARAKLIYDERTQISHDYGI